MSKLEDMYRSGYGRCLDIVKTLGIEMAEKEAKNRGVREHAAPGISSHLLRAAARKEAALELKIVATALASALVDEMHLPAVKTQQFLRLFNEKCDLYRYDPEAFEAAQYRLEAMPVITDMAKKYMEE